MHTVTLREVAQRAGVGVATASRALSGHPRCRESTRQRVRAAASVLGYRPDPGIAALAHRRLGRSTAYPLVWLQEQASGSANPLVSLLKKRGAALGYTLQQGVIADLGGPERCAQVLARRGVRGIILPSMDDSKVLATFDWSPFSVVALDQENFRVPFDTVLVDLFRSFYEAFERVRALGHRRIGVVLPSAPYARQNQVILGACALHANPRGAHIPPLILKARKRSTQHYGVETVAWFRRYRPTAVISKNDGAFWPLHDAGYRCPDDYSHVSITRGSTSPRAISGFDPQRSVLVDKILAQMDQAVRAGQRGPVEHPVAHLLEPSWRDGDTLAPIT